MTLCIVMRADDGIVALGDSTVLAGTIRSHKSKLIVHRVRAGCCFTLTSGLRSISDKVMSYAQAELATGEFNRLYEVATAFGRLLRRVHDEDARSLAVSRLVFDGHILLGGRMSGDPSPTAYLVYPQGNWIEVGRETPFLTIGKAQFGLAILTTLLGPGVPLERALKAGLIAFDATASSSSDVDYPIDVAILRAAAGSPIEQHVVDRNAIAPLLRVWRRAMVAVADAAPGPSLADPRSGLPIPRQSRE